MPALANPRHEFTLPEFQALLDYDVSTGNFYWRVDRYRVVTGSLAGQRHPSGYWMVGVGRRRYLAHRLAWLFTHGAWPSATIDHINGNRLDNRISNLRAASVAENTRNGRKRSTNTSGFKGVSWRAQSQMYRAYIVKDGRQYGLGLHKTPEAAHIAYLEAAARLHGEFASAG